MKPSKLLEHIKLTSLVLRDASPAVPYEVLVLQLKLINRKLFRAWPSIFSYYHYGTIYSAMSL